MTMTLAESLPTLDSTPLRVEPGRGRVLSAAAHLTYPRYARRIEDDDCTLRGWMLVGPDGERVALALLEAMGPARARLLSVTVAAAHRRHGLATALLRHVRQAEAPRGTKLEARYLSRIAAFDAVQRLLPAAGWGQPTARILYGRGDVSRADVLKFLGPDCATAGHGWQVLTWDQAERELGDVFALARATAAPAHLLPDYRLERVFKPNSLFLLDNGGPNPVLQGWLVTHDFEELDRTLYYSKFWVDHGFSTIHPLITSTLLRLAIRHQQRLWREGAAPRFAEFDVPLEYSRWTRAVWRHLAPHLDSTWGLWGVDLVS